jgi:hypothetical protein
MWVKGSPQRGIIAISKPRIAQYEEKLGLGVTVRKTGPDASFFFYINVNMHSATMQKHRLATYRIGARGLPSDVWRRVTEHASGDICEEVTIPGVAVYARGSTWSGMVTGGFMGAMSGGLINVGINFIGAGASAAGYSMAGAGTMSGWYD